MTRVRETNLRDTYRSHRVLVFCCGGGRVDFLHGCDGSGGTPERCFSR